MSTDIANLLVSANWNGDSAEHGLDRLDAKFVRTEKAAQQFGQKINQAGNESNQSTGKIDQAGKTVNSTGNKMERAGKQVGNLSDRLRDSRGKFATAGQGASEFTGKVKSVDSASESAGSRIGALISKITGFNRASREMSSGGGMSSFLPGLANISEIIQGIPQIGQLAGALVRPLTSAAEAGIKFNAFMETSKIGFETLLGSSDKALAHISELSKFADKTPFQFEDLVGASQRMQAFGFAAGDVIPTLTAVGNAVSSTGSISKESLDGVLLALGQMKTKGKVSAEEMNQLAERGIPAWDLLAKAIGKTVAQTQKLAAAGQLNGGMAVKAILAQGEARYGGQMTRVSNTFTGRMSNLEDIRQQAQGKATENLTRDISDTVGAALQRGDVASSLAATINMAISPVSGLIKTAAVGLLGGSITSGLTEGIAAGKSVVAGSLVDLALGDGGIVKTVKSALGINSPSTVFIGLGINAAEGFAIGIESGLGIASSATMRMIGNVTAQAKSKLSLDKLVSREPDFLDKLKSGSQKRGINPDHMLNVMAVETSGTFNPAAKNPTSSASGLIQFMASTAKELGTTTAALRSMSATKQLDYVFKYFDHYFKGKDLSSQGALYSAVGTGKVGRGDESVVMRRGDRGYAGNAPTWDRNGDGLIKQGEMALAAVAKLGAGVNFSVNGGVPVRIVNAAESLIGGGFTRAKQREDYTSGRDPFVKPAWTQANRASGGFQDRFDKETGFSALTLPVGGLLTSIQRTADLLPQIPRVFEESARAAEKTHLATSYILDDVEKTGDAGNAAVDSFNKADQAVGAWADRVIQKSNKAWKEMSDGFQSTFTSALSSTEGGVKGMFSRMGLGFADMVRQMILKAAAAKLSGYLFGDVSDDNNTGGFFGKLAGKFSGGKSKKSDKTNEAVGAVVNSTVNSIENSVLKNQSNGTAVGALDQAGEKMKGAIEGAGNKSTDAVNSSGKAQAGTLATVGQGIVGQIASIASMIMAGNSGGGFWKGLFGAALSGAISGGIGKWASGGGSTDLGGGSSYTPGGTGDVRPRFAGPHALGGMITAATGGKLIQVAEGGFDELVLSTDPKHRARTAALLSSFMQRTNIFPAFAAGGFANDNYVPPVNSSGLSSNRAPQKNVTIHFKQEIHTPDAASFQRSARQNARAMRGALATEIR